MLVCVVSLFRCNGRGGGADHSQQMQQQQQTIITDMITSRANIPILRPRVSRKLQGGREGKKKERERNGEGGREGEYGN